MANVENIMHPRFVTIINFWGVHGMSFVHYLTNLAAITAYIVTQCLLRVPGYDYKGIIRNTQSNIIYNPSGYTNTKVHTSLV